MRFMLVAMCVTSLTHMHDIASDLRPFGGGGGGGPSTPPNSIYIIIHLHTAL